MEQVERKIVGKVDFASFADANAAFQREKLKWFYRAMWGASVLAAVWCAISPSVLSLAAVGAGFGGMLGTWLPEKLLIKRKLRRLFSQSAGLQKKLEYTWDEQCLRYASADGHHRMAWHDFLKGIETESVFLLFHNELLYQLVPKHLFQDSKLIQDFREVAQAGGVTWRK